MISNSDSGHISYARYSILTIKVVYGQIYLLFAMVAAGTCQTALNAIAPLGAQFLAWTVNTYKGTLGPCLRRRGGLLPGRRLWRPQRSRRNAMISPRSVASKIWLFSPRWCPKVNLPFGRTHGATCLVPRIHTRHARTHRRLVTQDDPGRAAASLVSCPDGAHWLYAIPCCLP